MFFINNTPVKSFSNPVDNAEATLKQLQPYFQQILMAATGTNIGFRYEEAFGWYGALWKFMEPHRMNVQ